MKNKSIAKLSFVLFLLALCLSALSQTEQNNEYADLFIYITHIDAVRDDTVFATIGAGKMQGIKANTTVKVLGSIKSKIKERKNIEMGYAIVNTVYDDSSTVTILRYDKTNPLTAIHDYDYIIAADIKIPSLPYHGPVFDLIKRNINFYVGGIRVFNLNTLLYHDSKDLEDSIINVCANSLHGIYEAIKDDEKYKYLYDSIPVGRYKGQSVMRILEKGNANDIYSFIKYVNTYSLTYTSNDWNFPEIFATWVIYKAPYSDRELLDSVYYFRNNAAEKKRVINENKALILEEKMVYYWGATSLDFLGNEKYDTADKILSIAIEVGREINDTDGLGYCYLYKAEMLHHQYNYTEAIKLCGEARKYFTLLKNYPSLLRTDIKEGYCYYAQKKYKEAIVIQEKIISDFELHKNEFTELDKNDFEPKIYSNLGYSFYDLFDFKNAQINFQKAISINNEQNTLTSKRRNIIYYDMVATIYKKQSMDNEALLAYRNLLLSYKNLGNTEKVASTYNNMAYVLFNLGNLRESIENYNKAFETYLGMESYSSAGFSKSGAAQAYFRLGKYDTAIALHKQAITYREMKQDYSGMAYSWNKLGSLYTETGEKKLALAALDSALRYYFLDNDSSEIYDVYITYGDLYSKENNNLKAFEKYIKAYAMAKQSKNTIHIIESAYKTGAATYAYDTATSRKYYSICYTLAKGMGDVSNQIYSLLNLANLSSMNFQFQDSRNKIDQALGIANFNNNRRDIAVCYKFMAGIYTNELNIDKANDYYLKAIFIFDSLGEVTQNPALYSSIANNLISKGDFINAEKNYLKAITTAGQNDNTYNQAEALSSLSYLYGLTGDIEKSLLIADSAIKLMKTIGNESYVANCYLNKGNTYQRASDYKQANYYYSKADSIYHKENNLINLSTSQNNIGTLYYWQADYDGSLPYIKNAYSILEKINLRNASWILYSVNLGELYVSKKDYPTALKYLLPAYKLAKEKKLNRLSADAALVLGKMEYQRNNYPLALTYMEEAAQFGTLSKESEKIIESSLYLGRVYLKLNNREKGIEFMNICVTESARFGIVKYNWEALYDLGMIYYNSSKFDSSVIYFRQAIAIVEESSSKVFDDEKVKNKYANDVRKVDLYTKIISAFVELKNTDEALEYANRSNIQGIKEKISQGGILINDEKKSDAIKKAKQLDLQLKTVKENLSKERAKPANEQNREIVSSYERTILNVESNYKNYIDSLVTAYPGMKDNFSKHANPEDFKTYKRKIPSDVAVVLYIVNEDNLLIFTVTNETKKVNIVKIKQSDLEHKLKTFVGLLNVPNKADGAHTLKLRGGQLLEDPKPMGGASLMGTSKDLYKILIEPVADDIKGKTKLCIIPNGKLCNIPFQVLGTATQTGDFNFLVEHYSIFYINKLDVFLQASIGNDSISSMAAFGNPDFNNTQQKLPSAEKEVKDIQTILTRGDYYYGKQATEEKAKNCLESKHFIHFATHGILDNSNFKNSYIKFSADAGDDGNLSINEINGLEMNKCDLVVLSACETAITNDSIKGWYYSAANSFIESGAKSVIASLWSVDDNATSILMTEFYKNLKTMPKADALRQAQATLSKDPAYVHPFFWGAFVLYGDWR